MNDQPADPATEDDNRPVPPADDELQTSLPVRPDPRQPAYDAVYSYIRGLGTYLPPDPVHRNAVIWRAVQAALDATHLGRCISSHCAEDDHMVTVEEEPERPGLRERHRAAWAALTPEEQAARLKGFDTASDVVHPATEPQASSPHGVDE